MLPQISPNRRIAFFAFLASAPPRNSLSTAAFSMARTKQTSRKAGKGPVIRQSMSPGSKRRQRRSELNAQRAELRTQVALFPSIYDGEEQMQLVATLGAAESEATPDGPARVATRVFPPSW